MVVETCKLSIYLGDVSSLKDKRKILKSLIERVKTRFNVSISEVELNDTHRNSVVGIAHVSNESSHSDSVISTVINFVENDFRVEVTDVFIEKIYV